METPDTPGRQNKSVSLPWTLYCELMAALREDGNPPLAHWVCDAIRQKLDTRNRRAKSA